MKRCRLRLRCPHCKRFYVVRCDGSIRSHGCPRVHESDLLHGGEVEAPRKVKP